MELEFKKQYCYNLIEETRIETGAGGIVQAQDLSLGRTVAIKYVKIPGNNTKEGIQFYQKAFSEVRVMISLGEENLNIPHIFDTYYDEGQSVLYIIMEWIKGTTLEEKMRAPELTFLQWMIELCNILSAMNKKHLAHKDIKPANIMITDSNELFLIDFNISIATPNLIEGTIHYKAPEMSQNSKYQGREKVDMFSIGVMLYEFYTGAVPVKTVDYAKNRSRGSFEWDIFVEPKTKNPKINDYINEIIVKCMKLDPRMRYRNYSELKNELVKAVRNIKWEKKKK